MLKTPGDWNRKREIHPAVFWLQAAEPRGTNVKPKTSLKSKKAAREGFQMLPQAEDLTKNMAVVGGGSLSPRGRDLCLLLFCFPLRIRKGVQ